MRLVMEPLGVPAEVVHPGSLKRWTDFSPNHHYIDYSASGEPPNHNTSPFPCDTELNRKIILWCVYEISVEYIILFYLQC